MSGLTGPTYTMLTVSTLLVSGCAATVPMNPRLPIEVDASGGSPKYMQNGKLLDQSDMVDQLGSNPAIQPHIAASFGLAALTGLTAGVGGGFGPMPFIQWATGARDPRWWLAAVGGVSLAVSIPLALASRSQFDKAIRLHNEFVKIRPYPPVDPPENVLLIKPPELAPEGFGFAFDKPPEHAATACKMAGYQASETDGLFACNGLPSNEIPAASAELSFADGRISKMRIVVHPPEDVEGWVGSFRKTQSAVTQIYGKPAQRSFVIPDECKPVEQFLGCVADGRVKGSAIWTGRNERLVSMTIVASPPPSTIVVDVVRAQPTSAR